MPRLPDNPDRHFSAEECRDNIENDIGNLFESLVAGYGRLLDDSPLKIIVAGLKPDCSVHGCVDEQDCNDGTQNDPPIGNLNARYRCSSAKPFHDFPPS
jgi:hypothetical protein